MVQTGTRNGRCTESHHHSVATHPELWTNTTGNSPSSALKPELVQTRLQRLKTHHYSHTRHWRTVSTCISPKDSALRTKPRRSSYQAQGSLPTASKLATSSQV